ncbi:MAG: S8 family serine peptidase [Archangiaceae bacterium]|nr:S8 family serine peptidase [Archangiaceae bacterium]
MPKPYDRPHLFVRKAPSVHGFTSVSAGGGRAKRKEHAREVHGPKLQAQFEKAVATPEDAPRPIRVEFRSEKGFDLKLESLDSSKEGGIELLSVREAGGVTYATVLIPPARLKRFRTIFEQYIKENTDKGSPRHSALVDSIAAIRRAALESVWTELDAPLPGDRATTWFEIWLRRKGATVESFREAAAAMNLTTVTSEIQFIDRTVTLLKATTAQLEQLLEEDPAIAEVRLARTVATDFTEMSGQEQVAWMRDLAERLVAPPDAAPAVCVLDTGVNRGHALLKPALAETDLHAYVRDWQVDDHHGHGTELAGTALYGDLSQPLAHRARVALYHRLESVKILPPPPGENDPRLWGALTAESVARAELAAPDRSRVVCLAVTSTAASDRGRPSSWSAALDKLAAGYEDEEPKLICISAGNVELDDFARYPASNESQGIFDPGQAWNAVTVGAVADRAAISEPTFAGWKAVAGNGDLGPSSSTSQPWNNKATWPLKPDILMPGGNAALDPGGRRVDTPDSQGILTTHRDSVRRQFSVTRDTSAATALAARLAARLQAKYPDLWPETIRALMIHSAEWTPQMIARYPGRKRAKAPQLRLRRPT